MTTPGTGNLVRHELYSIHNVVQNTLTSYPKELVIGVLREEFAQDTYYRYVSDEFGFPKVVDVTDLPQDAGYNDNSTTRIYIGEAFHFDAIFYPAILVKVSSAKYVPISMNRNKDVIEYEKYYIEDEHGNLRSYFTPKYIDLAGAWEGTISIDILTRDIYSRDNLIDILMLMFADIRFESFRKAGLLIKSGQPSLGGVAESEDRQQDKLYKASISVDFRSEWRRLIPIDGIIETINFCIDFRAFNTTEEQNIIVPDLEINQKLSLLDQIEIL
jgi:hypothetical protein